ncbi:MAG: MBL fold metallo-hydrolase, partial [Chlamydiia bacterium]|nr:MBL fold metallo-hydrolase [Chlamydiia bacterium]
MDYSIHPKNFENMCHARMDQLIGFERAPSQEGSSSINAFLAKLPDRANKQGVALAPKIASDVTYPTQKGKPCFTPVHTDHGWRLAIELDWTLTVEGGSGQKITETILIDPFEDFDPTRLHGTHADQVRVQNTLDRAAMGLNLYLKVTKQKLNSQGRKTEEFQGRDLLAQDRFFAVLERSELVKNATYSYRLADLDQENRNLKLGSDQQLKITKRTDQKALYGKEAQAAQRIFNEELGRGGTSRASAVLAKDSQGEAHTYREKMNLMRMLSNDIPRYEGKLKGAQEKRLQKQVQEVLDWAGGEGRKFLEPEMRRDGTPVVSAANIKLNDMLSRIYRFGLQDQLLPQDIGSPLHPYLRISVPGKANIADDALWDDFKTRDVKDLENDRTTYEDAAGNQRPHLGLVTQVKRLLPTKKALQVGAGALKAKLGSRTLYAYSKNYVDKQDFTGDNKQIFNATQSARLKGHAYYAEGVNKHSSEGRAVETLPFVADTSAMTQHLFSHATNYYAVPSRGKHGTMQSIRVATDPVSKINPILYPVKGDQASRTRDLPDVDVLVLSHVHRDHLEDAFAGYLAKKTQPVMICPPGSGELLRSLGFKQVVEGHPGQTITVDVTINNEEHQLEVKPLPAKHVGQHGAFDLHESATLGYAFRTDAFGETEGKKNYHYFAGDTAVLDPAHQEAIRNRIHILSSNMPAGPETSGDAERRHMASTHQSTADSLEQYLSQGLGLFHAQNGEAKSMTKAAFMEAMLNRRLTYNHHMTYMLGTLRQDEAAQSLSHVISE